MKPCTRRQYLDCANKHRLRPKIGYWSPLIVEWHQVNEKGEALAKESVSAGKHEYFIGDKS